MDEFDSLPPHVKEFFKSLTPEDIASIREGIAIARATHTMAKFWKWTFILAVSAFSGMAALGQSAEWLWNKLRGE